MATGGRRISDGYARERRRISPLATVESRPGREAAGQRRGVTVNTTVGSTMTARRIGAGFAATVPVYQSAGFTLFSGERSPTWGSGMGRSRR